MKIARIATILFTSVSVVAHAAPPSFERDIVVVDFDDKSAEVLKRPWNRAYAADVTERLLAAKARAVVIKIFMDTPSADEAIDARLEQVMKGGRVILQASISSEPPVSSDLQERFRFRGPVTGVKPNLTAKAGWLPIARFQAAAARVCFADALDVTIAPVIEELNGRLYKSLNTCILEEAIGSELASIGPATAKIGPWRLPVNADAGVPVRLVRTPLPSRISAQDVLLATGPITGIEGRIAILTYSEAKSPTRIIEGEAMKIHDAFLAVLRGFYETLRP